MRIAIPSLDDRGIEGEISMHFGRSPYYTFVDIEDGEIKNIEVFPISYENHKVGELPNFVKEHGGEIVIAYGMGQRAVDFFNQLGIEVITGAVGKIKDIIKDFIKGNLSIDKSWKEHGDFKKHEH